MPPLHYRLRIRTAADDADDLVVTSIPEGVNPYIAQDGIPEGDGQTLNPVTGEVVSGAMTVGVIDAIASFAVDELVTSDGLEYISQAAMEAAGWVIVDTSGIIAWVFGATDEVYAGSRSLKAEVNGLGGGGLVSATRVFTAADGIQPLRAYSVRVRARVRPRPWFDVSSKLYVTGSTGPTEAAVTLDDTWQLLTVNATSTVDGELTVTIQRDGGPPFVQDIDAWFDAVEIWTHTTGEGRLVTSRLADAQGRQQLLSRRAFIEETANGTDFTVLMPGYVTLCELTTAIRYTIGVGESRRVEESVRVFEVAEPGFDRVSCILGGPILGNFGPFQDRGRPRFKVTFRNSLHVTLAWQDGLIYGPIGEVGRPLEEHNRDFLNGLASPYAGYLNQKIDGFEVGGSPFADLAVRLLALDTGPGVTENYPAAIDKDLTPIGASVEGTLITERGLLNSGDAIKVYWPVTPPPGGPTFPAQPTVGTMFRLICFPRTISEQNPLHWSGHPMDLATGLLTLRGRPYDAASAAAVRAALGDSLFIEIRVTASMSLKDALEKIVYGPFGVGTRFNDDGELEFFTTRRRPSDAPTETITLADLVDTSPPVWRIEESSAVNKVTFRFRAFAKVDLSGHGINSADAATTPIDYLTVRELPIEATPNPSDYEVYGDRSITYDLPGQLVNTDPQDYVAAVAADLFEERGRGAIVSQLAVRRDGPDPRIGEETILDLPHLPTANPTQSPVSQRGTTPRIAVVVRRTPTPEGPLLTVQDRGIALQAGLVPEFTIVPSSGEPRKIATVAITNGVALAAAGVMVRIEWAVSSTTPLTGQLLRTLDPATDELTFDLPAVDAGARVWARMRTEQVGTRPGTWSAFDDADLDDLDAPTDFTGQLSGGFIDLVWVLGANATDIPIEILLREDADPDFDSIVILPAGSTQYRLQLPSPETDYVIGVRHHEAAPFAGVSPTTTLAETSEETIGLTAPIDPAVFADGAGTFGLEVTATVLPSGTEFWVAIETAVGSGTPDTSSAVQLLPSVAGGRTRFTNPIIAANDGKLRYLKARHVVGEAESDFCLELGVQPWLLLPPVDPPGPTPDDGDPPSGLTVLTVPVTLVTGLPPLCIRNIPADAIELTPWRGTAKQLPTAGVTSAYIGMTVDYTTAPVGAFVAIKYEDPATGDVFFLDGVDGPQIPIDEASLDLLDEFGALRTPKCWVVNGLPVAVLEAAAAGRLRYFGVIGGGAAAEDVSIPELTIYLTSQAPDQPPGEPKPVPPAQIPATNSQYVEQGAGNPTDTIPVGFFQAFEVDAVPDEDGEVTLRLGFFHTTAAGVYTRVGYFDKAKITAADGTVLWSDSFEYADIAAMLAAGWSFVDTMGAVSTTSISSTEVTDGAKALKIEVTGGPPTDSDCYATRVVTGLPAGAVVTFSADVFENEEANGSSGIACGIEIDSAGTTGLGGDEGDPGNDPIPDPPPGGFPPIPAGGARPFGMFNLPAAGLGFLNTTIVLATPSNIQRMLDQANDAGCKLCIQFGAGERVWKNPVSGVNGTFQEELWKRAFDAVYDFPPARNDLEAAIADSTQFAWASMLGDEFFQKGPRYGGTVPYGVVEHLAQHSKAAYPLWRTMTTADVVDQAWWVTRHMDGLDAFMADYMMVRGDCLTWRTRFLNRCVAINHQAILAPHYRHINAVVNGRYATPAEVRHYNQILLGPDPTGKLIGSLGWKFDLEMYSQSGFVDALHWSRDYFGSND